MAAALVEFPFGLFKTHPDIAHNFVNMPNAVKIQLKLVQLLVDLMEALNLGISINDHLAGLIVHHLRRDLSLFAEIVHLVADVVQHTLKVCLQLLDRGMIEKKDAV